eukprot:TRINITY_DN47879_c0_g1_i1.p1 TRINITY_DN47879_c0_g1~~TRINITY_DN47879_c0_g1_i1.p1  ORF type:complete len:257 (+),score=81.94 TRINITY_DN47879_c0_g1_i1:248-1018(+)
MRSASGAAMSGGQSDVDAAVLAEVEALQEEMKEVVSGMQQLTSELKGHNTQSGRAFGWVSEGRKRAEELIVKFAEKIKQLARGDHEEALAALIPGLQVLCQLVQVAGQGLVWASGHARLAVDWTEEQTEKLRTALEGAYARLPGSGLQRARAVLDDLGTRMEEYAAMPASVLDGVTESMQHGTASVMRKAPVVGFTFDGAASICNDGSLSIPARVFHLLWFLVVTFYCWSRHQVHVLHSYLFGETKDCPADCPITS